MGEHGKCRGYYNILLVCGVLTCFTGTSFLQAEAGCGERENPNCCTGRNNECVELNTSKGVCYCDTYCEKTGDCCEDYRRVCKISAIDCELGPWGAWTECSVPCAVGTKQRSRQVTVPPRNGGAPCPDLRQRRGCFGTSSLCHTAKDIAKILPDSFKRNLRDPWRRPHMLMKESKPSYCVWLQVTEASAACLQASWTARLVSERSVCAKCQSVAMDTTGHCAGDGLEAMRTFWTAASVPGCHGSWVRQVSSGGCPCPQRSVLFV